jgi:hypothetical protein
MEMGEEICQEYLNLCNKTNKLVTENVGIAFAIVIWDGNLHGCGSN